MATKYEFEGWQLELSALADDTMWAKNQDYASEKDVLSNIKGDAADLGLTPEAVALVYFSKHLRALKKGMLGQELQSESLEERFVDAYNFLHILWALHQEHKSAPKDLEVRTLDEFPVIGERNIGPVDS